MVVDKIFGKRKTFRWVGDQTLPLRTPLVNQRPHGRYYFMYLYTIERNGLKSYLVLHIL